LQAGTAEIEEESPLVVGGFQVVKGLRLVHAREGLQGLELDNDRRVTDKIGLVKGLEALPLVMDRQLDLADFAVDAD
jgi:hypothetical protein